MPQKNATFLASVIDLLLDAVCVVDAKGYFVFVSAAGEAIFGYTPQEMVGMRMIDLVAPEDRERTLQAAQRVMAGSSHLHFENRYLRKDGTLIDLMWSARWSEANQIRIAVARDISARKRAESMQAATYAISEAAHAAKDMPSLFQNIHQIIDRLLPSLTVAMALLDETSQRLEFPYCVTAGAAQSEPTEPAMRAFCEEIIQAAQTRLFSRDRLQEIPPGLQTLLECDLSSWLGTPLSTHKGVVGALVLKSHATGAQYTPEDKELLQYISTQVASAIERKRLYASLQYMAQYDALTGLPNRGLLLDRLQTAITRAQREGRFLSLLFLDLDKFKQVNDALGHMAGDHLLKAFGDRLKHCVRASDTVARMGGDEFVVLLESSQPLDDHQVAIQKMREAFEAPFEIQGKRLHIRPSMGVANYPKHGIDAHQLLQHADRSMYAVKKSQK